MDESPKYKSKIQAPTSSFYLILLYKDPEQEKLIYGERNQDSDCLWQGGARLGKNI